MQCPNCGGDTNVTETRQVGKNELRRRRACVVCKQRFSTRERIVPPTLRVEKRRGVVEPYDRAKLRHSMAQVSRRRPVSDEILDELVDRIESQLGREQARTVRWSHLLTLVLDALRAVDTVAARRMESNYLDDTGALRLDEAEPAPTGQPQLGLFADET